MHQVPTPFTLKSGLSCSVRLCFDDHGSLVIFRSASVRPKHLFDPYHIGPFLVGWLATLPQSH